MGRKGETFPGLDVIRGEKLRPPRDGEPAKGSKRRRTPEEIAKLPPSEQRRAIGGRRKPRILGTVGRPSKITTELIRQIVEAMATGAPVEVCAGALGVSRLTIAEWLSKGSDSKHRGTLLADFVTAVARARDEFRLSTYGRIAMGGKGYQGAAWLAERLFAELAPPKKQLEHSGPGVGGAIRIVASSVEIPAEIPDDHPSVIAAATAVNVDVKPVNGHANGNGHAPARAPIGFLPLEDDPEE